MTHGCHNSPDLSSCYHFIIGGSWLTSPGPLLSIVITGQRTLCRIALHAAWLTAGSASVMTHCSLGAADRGWRPLRDSVQRSDSESFPLLKIFRNCNDFFRTKWLIEVMQKPLIPVPVIDSNYYFVTRDRWIIRHCEWALRPGLWFSSVTQITCYWSHHAALSGQVWHQDKRAPAQSNHHCSTFCRIIK